MSAATSTMNILNSNKVAIGFFVVAAAGAGGVCWYIYSSINRRSARIQSGQVSCILSHHLLSQPILSRVKPRRNPTPQPPKSLPTMSPTSISHPVNSTANKNRPTPSPPAAVALLPSSRPSLSLVPKTSPPNHRSSTPHRPSTVRSRQDRAVARRSRKLSRTRRGGRKGLLLISESKWWRKRR
jgi:hypothetical protein